ncbi:MAG: hypothetical protein AUJ92_12150 [Armatimonadetes bacterium CG2_30_59_28]|nr:Gfo/Idh/MocA family oxidoreductase [Armatimonadota bacterium]OIO93547.1 MAG: hypothetical protein AUJ92_12150 [Armatimonadetes bacterium CG2_30_59_28]PIU66872.1 MAG: hypothetical protein COS85_03000 [Armatimonadetes bacterium CG07_land_8_20_14_0_80_59_28]PIX40229.1 MAG: hypothetical protein COZ56_15270 [Armatimonadetes bacterium CG_4_8_14_3_um_filter_58_9]PIY40188.1 MAG: hypothetical protein COZ05_18080 [Armatimonadetes bacterium CG_4_10_14_3_um_filter_59_10]
MDKLRIGLIGAGWMGQLRTKALQSTGEGVLVGVADVNLSRATALAPNREAAFTDMRELLEKTQPDAVIVATSESAHREAAVVALQAGAHVLVEKPCATTVQDCDAMIAASEDSGRLLMVGHTLRFDPRYALAAHRIQNGEIGETIHAFCRRNNTVNSPARLNFSTGVLQFLGIHEFDWLLWSLPDKPVQVSAVAVRKKLPVDDTVFTTICFAGGSVAVVETSWALPAQITRGLHAEAQVVGTEGAIYVDGSRGGVLLHSSAVGDDELLDTVYTVELNGRLSGPAFEETRHFLQCVRTGESPCCDGTSGRAAVSILEAAEQSIHTRTPIGL